MNMSYMFYECASLISYKEISKLNTSFVQDMSYLFCNCKYLEEIKDISDWDTSNVKNISCIFCHIYSLIKLCDIGNCNTKSFNNISYLFYVVVLCKYCLKYQNGILLLWQIYLQIYFLIVFKCFLSFSFLILSGSTYPTLGFLLNYPLYVSSLFINSFLNCSSKTDFLLILFPSFQFLH